MTLGIKVGPERQSFLNLEETQAPFCEVWFNIVKKDDYTELFSEVTRRKIQVGLHFWGHLPDQTWTNIALPDKAIVEPSMKQIKDTIDIAAKNKFQYVNIHPSSYAKTTIDFANESIAVVGDPIDKELAEKIFLENLSLLDAYAINRNVVLTLETVPSKDTIGWRDPDARKHPLETYTLGNSLVVKAATMGFTVANDFGHTVCTTASENRLELLENLQTITKQFFSETKLLHLGYVIPPYTGTDFHDQLDNPIFDTDQAIPNRREMQELLEPFKTRSDVWALVEPSDQHAKNYFLAKKMLF